MRDEFNEKKHDAGENESPENYRDEKRNGLASQSADYTGKLRTADLAAASLEAVKKTRKSAVEYSGDSAVRPIKIIKRNKQETVENTVTDSAVKAPSFEAPSINLRGAVNIVKGWISERAANRQIEKYAATRNLFAWKTGSD